MAKSITEIAKALKVAPKTLYNWRETRPILFRVVTKHFKKNSIEEDELSSLISSLDKKEREMYILEIKSKVLKKEIDDSKKPSGSQ